jgi:energy-coupling factor transporter ATP-binding protein EcfA2
MEFPSLKLVELQSFSLYRNRPELLLDLDIPVFCLAGANGLGKSTFLNAVTYGLTGVIPNPSDRFDSIEEHYHHNLPYAAEYFSGRIDEDARDAAEIRLQFTLGSHSYDLTRGLFEPEQLRSLTITNGERNVHSVHDATEADLNERYQQQVVTDTGLGTFAQYVFLQHFVFTFDERRRLLFWEGHLVEQALYLAFGISGPGAQQADTWRRQADRYDSQARNLQYQATTARNRLAELEEETGEGGEGSADKNSVAHYERLIDERRRKTDAARRAATAEQDASLELQRVKASELAARNEYEEAFNEHLGLIRNPADHPIVAAAVEHSTCALCGTSGEQVARAVVRRLDDDVCPLCDSPISNLSADAKQTLTRTKELGKVLEKLEKASVRQRNTVSRLTNEATAAQRAAEEAASAVREFEARNEDLPQLDASGLEGVKQRLVAQIEESITRRDSFRAKRDERRRQLRKVQAELASNYREAEQRFVPLFTSLAESFLGLELELQLDVRRNAVELVLSVEGTRRRLISQLSESQRYFVDIALRMALTQHMVGPAAPATLFIDTPEGSLDVAYESRAGSMFAGYVAGPRQIVMTANLNASQLLRELARKCGREAMKVVRMIEWADLSDVQASSEELFEEAYAAIEAELDQGPTG